MNLRRGIAAGTAVVCLAVCVASVLATRTRAAEGKQLTVERIYGQPSLSGKLTPGLTWSPDSKELGYLEIKHQNGETRTSLWVMDAKTGARHELISAEKLDTVLPAGPEKLTQATGLGRHAPSRYQWSPDGKGVLFDGPTGLAWYDLKTQTAKTLVSGQGDIADPKISPDSRTVSFVRDHNLWLVDVASATERALTTGGTEALRKGELDWVYPEELENRTAYWWAPDSSAIAYFEMDESKVNQYPLVDFQSFSGEADMERYPVAGGANPVVHVYVAPVNGGAAQLMDTGADTNIYVPRVDWLPDSRTLAIQRMNRAQNKLELMLADAANGKTHVILTEQDRYWVNVADDLHFLKDGKRFFWSSERTGYRHLYLYNTEGKELKQLTSGDWQLSDFEAVDEAKGVVYFIARRETPLERHLYKVNLDGSGLERISKDAGTDDPHFAPDASAFYDVFSNTMTPPRQDLYRADGTKVATINENNVDELAGYHLSPMEFLKVKAKDGTELNASIVKPPDFDASKKYPVLIFTYGGPHAQVVTNQWGGTTFLWHEMMAEKGFLIFSLDNRGSYGRGHVFETPLYHRLGEHELSDQLDGVAYLKSLPYVDGNRIGIWGWSYGGHMTLQAMFGAPNVFKAGFAGGPVTDWHYYDTIYTERYLGLPSENEKGYEESSPIHKADALKGKLLIAHGTGDDNVHFANTLAVLNKLIADGKYVQVMPFPGRGHGVGDSPARIILMNRVTKFFEDNLK